MAHLLAIPFPAQGHLNPMLELCSRFVSSGLFVTYLVTVKRSDFITNSKLESTSFRFMFLPDEFLPRFTVLTNLSQFNMELERKIKSTLPSIIQEINHDSTSPPLTCVLTDVAVPGAEDVCSSLRIAKATLSTFAASFHSIQNAVQLLRDNQLLPLRGSKKVIDFIPGMPPVCGSDFPSAYQNDNPLDPSLQRFQARNELMISKSEWILGNSFPELEPSQIEHLARDKFMPVGPLLPSSAFICESTDEEVSSHKSGLFKEDSTCLDWLNKQPCKSVVYVSMGSLAVLSSEEITQIYTGLKRSKKKILWVMRSDAAPTRHEDSDSQIEFVAWAPQLKVLKHSSVAAFLTHCGWNSVLEAVVTGVPMLCLPLMYEQHLNSVLAVEHLKVGVRLPQPCSSEEVQKSVELITGDSGSCFRENLSRLSFAARCAVFDRGGASQRNLQIFIDDLKQRALSKEKRIAMTR